jgi:hypothetical protein
VADGDGWCREVCWMAAVVCGSHVLCVSILLRR